MVKLTIDSKQIECKEGTTILEAARNAGIPIPTLCYFKDWNEVGACRVCVVDVQGAPRLCAACNTPVAEGMTVLTNSERVRRARRVNVQLLLSQHDCHCPTCKRNGNCSLQKLAAELNIIEQPYPVKVPENDWDPTLPLIRNESKCIKCFRCVNVCEKIQKIGVWQVNGTGAQTTVKIRDGLSLNGAGCTLCGQCITHCPVGALTERDDTRKVFRALEDPDKVVVMQIAPAVRAAWGEELGLDDTEATVGRMAAAAKKLGADYVLDTNFAADLTIMEEGAELLRRLENSESVMPMFTSCCPGWVRFLKLHYPELLGHLSTAKSPQQMFGAVIKTYFAKKTGIDPEKIVTVSVMPCSAKKYECGVPQLGDAAEHDVDIVLTTREFARMLRADHIDAARLEEAAFDTPLGQGAGVIFGASGGVMEQALRSAVYLLTGKNPEEETFHPIRTVTPDGIAENTYTVNGKTIRTAVASGLGNARAICEQVAAGAAPYDFIEIMACPGGCVGGGGQPIHDGEELAPERRDTLYRIEKSNSYLYAHENPAVAAYYADQPGEEAHAEIHRLLHTDQSTWDI